MRPELLMVLITFLSSRADSQKPMYGQQCSRSYGYEAVIQPNADVYIAGFFAMHEAGSNGVGCGTVRLPEMQSYEAIRWILDRLNKQGEILNGEFLTNSFIPGVKIGMLAYDYCSNPALAVSIAESLFPQFSSSDAQCQNGSSKPILGLIGASSSDDTKILSKFAQDQNLPLISYTSTAPELSDIEMFPNFMRTISPDGPLTGVIVKYLHRLNWNYVSIVYTDNSYGRGIYNEIRPRLAQAGICLTAAVSAVPDDNTNSTIDNILRKVIETNTTGVIYLGNSLLIDALLKQGELYPEAGKLQWIVTDSVPLSETFPGQLYPRGLVSVTPLGRKIIEFEDYWVRINSENPSAENPWYKDMYMEHYQCRLPGTNSSQYLVNCTTNTETQRRIEFVQDQFVEPVVHAVMTYAQALKQAHLDLCLGLPGVCQKLNNLQMSNFYQTYLRNVNFTYGKAERVESLASFTLEPYLMAATVKYQGNDIINPSFAVFSLNNYPSNVKYNFISVGTYINGFLEIIAEKLRFYDIPRTSILPNIPSSKCPTVPCSPCLGAIIDPKYVYIPGDVVINAVFSIHKPGPLPLTCGDFDSSPQQGIQSMQAFIFAVNYSNVVYAPSRGFLKGVKLGALGFDDCMSPILANQLITEVQHYSRSIQDRNSQNLLDPRTVQAYMARGLNPSLAVSMAQLMNTMKKPVMSVETWTTVLNDRQMYPYFLRAHFDLTYLAQAIVNIAIKNGWKFLQSVYNGNSWGEEANNILKEVAAKKGICIVASFSLKDGDSLVMNLRSRPYVQPVVVLLNVIEFRQFMETVKVKNAKKEFYFISLVGDSMGAMKGYEDIVGNMISLELWSPTTGDSTFTKMTRELQAIDFATYSTNPWMQEWNESTFNSSINSSAQNMFNETVFQANTDVISVIYGVIALVQGLDKTLTQYCGTGYHGICGAFMNAANQSKVFMQKISSETSFLEEKNIYSFSDIMGNIPFRYYQYSSDNKSFAKIGEYKPKEDYLLLESIMPYNSTHVQSSCPGVCMECLYLFGYQKFMFIPGDIIIPGIFDVHYRGDSPYSCADLRVLNGFQYTEAFSFALERINSGNKSNVYLNNVTLGGIGFDGCTDPIRASAIVTGIYSGALPKPNTDLAQTNLNIQDIAGWLSYDSDSTVNIATVLKRYGIPAVTPGATTPVLDDKKMYDTFFRTIPSDGIVAEAMARLSNFLGFSYIITLNAPEDGSRQAMKKFRTYAEALHICIGASYEFVTDGDINQIMTYMLQSSTKVVAVFANPDRYIDQLILARHTMDLNASKIVFITDQPWSNIVQQSSGIYPIHTISFRQDGETIINQFMSYLKGQSGILLNNHNPWMREYYETIMKCNLAGSYKYNIDCNTPHQLIGDSMIQQDHRVLPTVNAVDAIAGGIHLALQAKCGQNYSGVCNSFFSDNDTYKILMANMDSLYFQDIRNTLFHFYDREANRGLKFTRFLLSGDEKEEGTYINGTFTYVAPDSLKAVYVNTPSTCIGQCLQCQKDSTGAEEFMYIDGDLHIAALFDIHEMGGTPFTCGDINSRHGFQLMEAFNFAMNYVNEKKGMFQHKLKGVKLGSLIFDTCKSPVRAGSLVANYHARNFEIRTADYRIDPSLIDLYIGPMESEASIRVADVLAELGIPQISYGASSLELRNRRKYRYFIRTVPADDRQARALISILKKYDIPNIQLISQFSSIGEFGRDEFVRLTKLNHICVTAEFVIGQSGAVTVAETSNITLRLLEKPEARVVVIIMDNPYPLLLEAKKNSLVSGNFSFIGTDKWGFGIAGYENLIGLSNLISNHKVMTLNVETANYPELDLYLENKIPSNYNSNPWFRDYFEYIYNCSTGVPTILYPKVCPNSVMGYSRAQGYIQDPYVLYVINAVFSTALGIDQTLLEWCGGDKYMGVCNILRTHGERREYFLENIKRVQFIDNTGQPFYYTQDGESSRGYHVYEPQDNGIALYGPIVHVNGFYWEDIGSYNDTHYLKMDVRYKPNWNSTCNLPSSCPCVFPQYQPSHYMKQPSPLDLNIVFIIDVHAANPDGSLGCGAIDTGSYMQNVLAFLYAIKIINENKDSRFPGSLKLGGVVLDTCSQTSRIGEDVYSLLSGEPICRESNGIQVVPPSSIVAFVVMDSTNAIAASSMLSPLKITSISNSATSVELSDKLQHAYFLRTVPPDNIQALVIAGVLKTFGWNLVSVVYVDDSYGRSAVATLLSQTDSNNTSICFGRTIALSTSADITEAKRVIDLLNQLIGSKVVVVFVSTSQVRLLLQAQMEKGLNHRFIWIGSDTWANDMSQTKGYEETAAGAITIQIRSEFSKKFRDFVKTLQLNNTMGLPKDWFEEFYQIVHRCRILGSVVQKTYTKICSGDELLTDDMIVQDPYALHTIISVYSIAYGLDNIEACKSIGLTISSCLALQNDRKQVIYDSILKSQVPVLPDDLGNKTFTFKFVTPDAYGDIGYNIYNFRRSLTSAQYEYAQIGSSAGKLLLDTGLYQSYSFTDRSLPLSHCQIGSICQCLDKNGKTYSYSQGNTSYLITDDGKYVDPVTGRLVAIDERPELADRFYNIWGIIVATLAAAGAFAALCMFVYLLIIYPVRGGTTILGYMHCFGIILMYALVFVFIAHASIEICGLRRFCLGFIYSICYSAIFVKLVDCWHTKDMDDISLDKYKKIGNPCGLFFCACLIVLVQVLINAEWLILEDPGMVKVIYDSKLWPRCIPDNFYDQGLVLSNVFVMFLIFISVIVGLAAFGNEKNSRDCRWMLGGIVLTIPAWIVWCVVSTLGEYKTRDAAVAIGLLFNATVMLLCGPLRKLYLLNKYQERKRKSELAASQKDYNSMYGRQYDNMPQLQDTESIPGSSIGHNDAFIYEPNS